MAQTKKRRSRKHRGTQAGTVERPVPAARGGRGGGAAGAGVKAEARRQAQERRGARFDKPPTWRGALKRAALMALIFGLLVVLVLKKPVAEGLAVAALMLLLYIPMSYYTDRFIYNRRRRGRSAAGSAGKPRKS